MAMAIRCRGEKRLVNMAPAQTRSPTSRRHRKPPGPHPAPGRLRKGKAGQTYILQYEGGLYESLVSFYNEIRGLDFTIGAARSVPLSLKQALGRRLSDNEIANCFSCHSTGAVSGGRIDLEKITPGIRCEACHGPGGQHVLAGKAGQPNAKLIFNPGRLSGDEMSQDFCGSCQSGER